MPEKAIISHRGEKYEIGRGKRFYGIWAIGAPYEAPIDRWPENHDGWQQAWARFAAIEVPGTITAVTRERKGLRTVLQRRGQAADGGTAGQAAVPRPGHGAALLAGEGLLVLGVVLGLAGLFPSYEGGKSLLSQWDQVVPHLCYYVNSFLAGGQFAFPHRPARRGVHGGYHLFQGVRCETQFTPVIMPNGNIHLTVEPEVSALDFSNALTISGFTVPALSTRKASTEFELQDGQSFVIAGLIDNRVTDIYNKIPGLGDIPVLGNLSQQELPEKQIRVDGALHGETDLSQQRGSASTQARETVRDGSG